MTIIDCINVYPIFRKKLALSVTKTWIGCLFLLIPRILSAATDTNGLNEQNIQLVMTQNTGTELQLEVRQAPLAQILNRIADLTGVQIHYSVLPEGLVTATCVGPTAKQVLECLLDHKADLIFRYPSHAIKNDLPKQPAEVWVLGAKFDVNQTYSDACMAVGSQQHAIHRTTHTKKVGVQTESEPDESEELIQMAKSENPAERAEAIGRLLSVGRKNDASIREVLETALSDEDARVRVQAISSLSHREGAGAAAALREAIHDSDVSVRLTAVDRAGDDIVLLQQALLDEAESVRELAAIRLKSISKPNDFQ